MEELKEIIKQKAQERFDNDKGRILLRDLKFYLEEDAEVSANIGVKPMSPRQAIKTLLDINNNEGQTRYGKISSVEWAWLLLERVDPEYVKTLKRNYGKTEEGDDSQN